MPALARANRMMRATSRSCGRLNSILVLIQASEYRSARFARAAATPTPIKRESWTFLASFVREQLHSSPERLLVIEANGDCMAPTVVSGDRVIVDTGHKTPTPDGLYAIRDALAGIAIKRLQVVRSAKQTHVKIISDNPKQESEEVPLGELEVVGKVLCCLKLF